MAKSDFESRVKIQQIITSQLPEFILDESPKTVDFLKQYYISQEYQSGPVDIVENLDQYSKLDNLVSEVIVGFTSLTNDISSSDKTIQVSSTKGFPKTYGLLKIDDEIITYTGITTNTFTGCIRGFSAITDYHKDLEYEELVFSTSESNSHLKNSSVKNLSALFLQEFFNKIKYTLTPDLVDTKFVDNLNVGNFIKECKTLYQSKGTEESFRILFNVLFGETPKIINLEDFLIKPSASTYVRRRVVVADKISGDPYKLIGQTITKNNDPLTTASVSEVEIINRKGKTYYKLSLFLGYDDSFPTITGSFNVTGSTKNTDYVSVGSSVISVDTTIGFPTSGILYSGNNEITYTNKSVNQFFGCSGITSGISTASLIFSDETYYGYEDGDLTKKVEIRITGVLSSYKTLVTNSPISVGENINVKSVGEVIKNTNINPSYKQVFANSWIYNTSSRYQIDSFQTGQISQVTLKSEIDKSSLKVGDEIDILFRDSQTIVKSNLKITSISGNQITTDSGFSLSPSFDYDIRRKIKKALSSNVGLEYDSILPDVLNVYNENNDNMYVASNSLPSYQITKNIFSYNASSVTDQNALTLLYSKIVFSENISFLTGNEVYYKPSNSPISGLSEGSYYIQVFNDNEIRLYSSRSAIGTENYLSFGPLTTGTHNFTLSTQTSKVLSPQKILRKFPINDKNSTFSETKPGTVGMLINGVEILNYKSDDKIYYGPLDSVDVLNGGKDYDVINPPFLQISSGNALIQPVVEGSIKKIYISPQDFDIDVSVTVNVTGGNGSGCSFEPIFERRRREIEFDARQLSEGGGLDITNETITFLSNHNLKDGETIIYRPGNNQPLGINTFKLLNISSGNTLKNESSYYAKYISDTTIQLYQSLSDYNLGINTVGFTTIGASGIQKFATLPKNSLKEIKILNGGKGYTNQKLIVNPTGISTANNTISFKNHQFNDGELVKYSYVDTPISGLSTTNYYYVIKIDDDSFKLSDAGIGGTVLSNYLRKKVVNLSSTGQGYQIFNYPDISLNIEYSTIGLGSTQFKGKIEATPIIRGKIKHVYVYDGGSDYGSEIINFHKKPSISIKNGKYAQINPIIVNGMIKKAFVQYGGDDYYSLPDLVVSGSGVGAILKPIVEDNKITDVIVINSGYGYSTGDTKISVTSSGSGVVFNPKVRSLRINNNLLYD